MAALALFLERPDRSYRSGDTIEGTVRAQPRANLRCRRLSVAMRWEATGIAGVEGRLAGVADLGAHTWRRGELYEVRFSLPAPIGPYSYAGELVRVRWALKARADIPDAPDVIARAVRFVLTSPGDVEHPVGYRERPSAGIGAVWLGPKWRSPDDGPRDSGGSRLQRLLGRREPPAVQVEPRIVRAGHSLHVVVGGARLAGDPDTANVELVGVESAAPVGPRARRRELPGASALATARDDEHGTRAAEVRVPDDAAPSFEGRLYAVRWVVRITGARADARRRLEVPVAIVPR